jgi:pyridoxamine 5'-phosphate oxidase
LSEVIVPALDDENVLPDPIELFGEWFEEACEAGEVLPNTMALATSDPAGRPSVRFVLLKQFDGRGFVFFSNYESRKAEEIEANPFASAAIFWTELRRQVRIEGNVSKVSAAESDAYFETRDRGSQVGAWASPRSRLIPDRAHLEKEISGLEERFSGRPVPRPKSWGGYIIAPHRIEFWSERKDRLHDRVLYSLDGQQKWRIERLAP